MIAVLRFRVCLPPLENKFQKDILFPAASATESRAWDTGGIQKQAAESQMSFPQPTF